ncbi:hypothetical protein CPB97_011236 [Podila verticillata]|nr:hypothetical protein CPB97_011236 [Podila verticillata]
MKFLAATVALALAATATAQKIAINNPTTSTSWDVAKPQYLSWTGNCSSMGAAAKTVDIQLVNGPSTAVQFVAAVGTLDCSGNATSINNVTIPTTVASGTYSIRVMTQPENSYSTTFTVNNPASPATPSTTTTTGAPQTTTPAHSGAGQVVAGSMAALAGCAVAAMLL